MKKILLLKFFLGMTALLLAGCGGNPAAYTNNPYDPRVDRLREEMADGQIKKSGPTQFVPMNTLKELKPLAGTQMSLDRQMDVRTPATVRTITTGRYIDPNNSKVMYEASIIYQVQNSSQWNLRPNPPLELPHGNIVKPQNWATSSPLFAELDNELQITKKAAGQYQAAENLLLANVDAIKQSQSRMVEFQKQNKELLKKIQEANAKISKLEGIINRLKESPVKKISLKNSKIINTPLEVSATTKSQNISADSVQIVDKPIVLPSGNSNITSSTQANPEVGNGFTKDQLENMLNDND